MNDTPAPSTVPASAAARPVCAPNNAPAAMFSSGRGTNATVSAPYARPKTIAAAPPVSSGGQPDASSRCGSNSSIVDAAPSRTTTSSERRDHGDSSARERRGAGPEAGRTAGTGSNIRGE